MRRLWEITDFFYCPIVGHCLTLPEQIKILKKSRLQCKNPDPFEVHEFFGHKIREDCPLSRRVESYLNQKYRKEIAL